MGRKIMVVTAAYGAEQVRQAGGQRAMLPVIAGAGADGVEIRRELFNSEELLALPALGESIELLGLLACYSAPAALFMPDGTLNPDLPRYLSEANTLNALWLKVSTGPFQRHATSGRPAYAAEYQRHGAGRGERSDRLRTARAHAALPGRLSGNGAPRHADLRYGELAVGGRLPEEAARHWPLP